MDLAALRAKRGHILSLADRFGATNVRVFGSIARGENRPDSDVDLLVDLPSTQSLLVWSAFWQALEDVIGLKVDLAVSSDLRPEIRRAIVAEAIPL